MKIKNIITFIVAGLFSQLCLAQSLTEEVPMEGSVAPVIAEIVINMRHFPTDEDKEKLRQLREDESHSDAIRAIAGAVHDFEHSAQEDDVEALREIADNEDATAREQTLADIVANMEHMPNERQVARLAEVD